MVNETAGHEALQSWRKGRFCSVFGRCVAPMIWLAVVACLCTPRVVVARLSQVEGAPSFLEASKELYLEGRRAYLANDFATALSSWLRCMELVQTGGGDAEILDALAFDVARARLHLFKLDGGYSQLTEARDLLQSRLDSAADEVGTSAVRRETRKKTLALLAEIDALIEETDPGADAEPSPSEQPEKAPPAPPLPAPALPKDEASRSGAPSLALVPPAVRRRQRRLAGFSIATGVLAGSAGALAITGLVMGQRARTIASDRGLPLPDRRRHIRNGEVGNVLAISAGAAALGLAATSLGTAIAHRVALRRRRAR